jgi:hypothetical protein
MFDENDMIFNESDIYESENYVNQKSESDSVIFDENSDSSDEISLFNNFVQSYSNSLSYNYMNEFINDVYSKESSYKSSYIDNYKEKFKSNCNSSYTNSELYHDNTNTFSYKNHREEEKMMDIVKKNVKNNKISRIQKKNIKLKYKLVLNEIKRKNIEETLNLDIVKLRFKFVLNELLKYKKYDLNTDKIQNIYKNIYQNIILKDLKKYFKSKEKMRIKYKLVLIELKKRKTYLYGLMYEKFIASL